MRPNMKSYLVFTCIWLLTVILMAISSPALFYLASEILYFIDSSSPDTLALSTRLLQFPAEHNYLLAQTELGRRYVHGQGVEKNTTVGIKWLTQAAAGNDKQARDTLAMLFLFDSSESERHELIKSIKSSAAQNSFLSQNLLTVAYYY